MDSALQSKTVVQDAHHTHCPVRIQACHDTCSGRRRVTNPTRSVLDVSSDAQQVCERMLALQHKCVHPQTNKPYVTSYGGGRDTSPEGLQVGRRCPSQLLIITQTNVVEGRLHTWLCLPVSERGGSKVLSRKGSGASRICGQSERCHSERSSSRFRAGEVLMQICCLSPCV